MRLIALASGWCGIVSRIGLLLVLLFVSGCGAAQVKLSGRVLFNGAPLPGGRMTFRPADPGQNSISAELDGQGNYQVVLPAGEVSVSVDNRELEPPPPQGEVRLPIELPAEVKKKLIEGAKSGRPGPNSPESAGGKYVKIPTRYHAVETSELKYTLQRGEQTVNIELKD